MNQVQHARRASRRFGLAGFVALATAAVVHAGGTVDTSNSQITIGTAPQQGALSVEPSAGPGVAPAMPALGTIGTFGAMTGAVPAFPGGGTGVHGAFHATADLVIPAGSYDYASYRVDPGVIVLYQGKSTIRTTGDFVLDGQIIMDFGGLTVECAGDLSVRATQTTPPAGIETHAQLIKLDVAGALRFIDISPPGNQATSACGTEGGGDIELIGRGGVSGAATEVRFASFHARHVGIQSATSLVVEAAGIYTFHGAPATLRAFGGDFEISTSDVNSYGAISVEASGAVRNSRAYFRTNATDGVDTWNADVSCTAFGGPFVMTGGTLYTSGGGDIRCRASADAELHDNAIVEVVDTAGAMELTAFGGDVKLEAAAGTAVRLTNFGTGPVSLLASGAMSLTGNSAVKTTQGELKMRAFDGGVTASGNVTVETVAGAVDIGASGDVVASAGGDVKFLGDSLRVVGGRIDLAAQLVARTGDLTLTARGALAVLGTMTAATQFTATSVSGDVTFDDSAITTASNVGARSGDIRIETFAGATAGRIAARHALIATGDNAMESGDIVMRIVTVPRPTVKAYLLPTSVTLKLGAVRGAGLRAEGTIGFPTAAPMPSTPVPLPFVLDVGMRHLTGDLALRSNGRDREFKATGVLLRVSPSKTGTSKGVFSLRLDEDLTGVVPADGLVDVKLLLDGVEFAGTVRLTDGKFKLGSTRGAVAELLYPLAVAAQQKGGGKDTFSFTVGFASDGVTPDAMSDLEIELGDGFTTTVAAADFVRTGDRFVAKNPPSASGLALVVVDFEKETVQVKSKKVDLGALPAGSPIASRIGVAFGGDIRSVEISLSRKGTKLAY